MRIYDMDTKQYVDFCKVENPITKVEQLSHALYCYENEVFDIIYDKAQPALRAHVKSFGEEFLNKMECNFCTLHLEQQELQQGYIKQKKTQKNRLGHS